MRRAFLNVGTESNEYRRASVQAVVPVASCRIQISLAQSATAALLEVENPKCNSRDHGKFHIRSIQFILIVAALGV